MTACFEQRHNEKANFKRNDVIFEYAVATTRDKGIHTNMQTSEVECLLANYLIRYKSEGNRSFLSREAVECSAQRSVISTSLGLRAKIQL